jgi:hypothetical protein
LTPFGATSGASFPELTLLAGNIEDVEILASSTGNFSASSTSSSKPKKTPKNKTAKPSSNNTFNHNSPYATPSVYADKTHTFPSGNARSNLPNEEFDFISNLARFDKADEFRKIQADDSVPKGDRLVSINSPQRKLGIHESVLDKQQSKNSPSDTTGSDIIMDRFKHLSTTSPRPVSKILVEGDSSDEEANDVKSKLNDTKSKSNDIKSKSNDIKSKANDIKSTKSNSFSNEALSILKKKNDNQKPVAIQSPSVSKQSKQEQVVTMENPSIPTIPTGVFDKFCSENETQMEVYRSVGSLNFAHHLLAELDVSRHVVLLLGVGEASVMVMEAFYHLLNHSRMAGLSVLAIFAAGAPGSNGKRIELTPAIKAARKRLMSLERVQFTSSLSDVVKLQDSKLNLTIFDALGAKGELTSNAKKGLTDWMEKRLLLATGDSAGKLVYCIEGSAILTSLETPSPSIQLVTFGFARDEILPHLALARSILFVDTGISTKILAQISSLPASHFDQVYSEAFVCELEYNLDE